MKKLLVFALAALLMIPAFSFAATPQLVSVHGKLTDTLNNPYTGSKNFILRIYSAQSGGAPLYTEFWNSTTQQVSLATGGYFSVLMGSQTALTLPFDQQYWLELSVEGETLSPRYKLGSTPYTYRANITDNLAANANASGNLNMNSQNITNVNYLGVGTTSPNAPLTIQATSAADSIFIIGRSDNTSAIYFKNNANSANMGFIQSGSDATYMGSIANTSVVFYANNAERMRITGTGNVGIGTASPGNKLSVVNDIGILTSSPTVAGAAYLNFYGQANRALSAQILSLSTGTGELAFYTNGGATLGLYQNSGGNVGIGTTIPDSINRLQVNGRTQINSGSSSSSTTYGLVVGNDAGTINDFWIRDDGAGYLRAAAWTYGSDRRMKENITYFNEGLDKIMQLKSAGFDYINGTKNQLGFIAQDVQGVIPEAVTVSDNKTGYLGLKTDFVIPYLVNAVKEQQKQIEQLKSIVCQDHPLAQICK